MDRTPVQNAARLVGIVFLLVGIAGFIPGITTNLYDGLNFAGNDGNAELLGIFKVSVLHNIVHGLFGIAGLALAKTASGARTPARFAGRGRARPLPPFSRGFELDESPIRVVRLFAAGADYLSRLSSTKGFSCGFVLLLSSPC
jgi:uncharacterized membrane protein YuzA (DUF378 family)